MIKAVREPAVIRDDEASKKNKGTKVQPTAKFRLALFPNEILRNIFDLLNPIDGTSLGLTCKHFYELYHLAYPALVKLSTRCLEGERRSGWIRLRASCPHTGYSNCCLGHHMKMQQWGIILAEMEYNPGRVWRYEKIWVEEVSRFVWVREIPPCIFVSTCWSMGGKLRPRKERMLRSQTKALGLYEVKLKVRSLE